MLLPLPSQETAGFTNDAQRLRHNIGKDRCRPTGSSPNLRTELAGQPSACRRAFYQSPRAQATASAGEDRPLSDPGNKAYFQRSDTGLPQLLRWFNHQRPSLARFLFLREIPSVAFAKRSHRQSNTGYGGAPGSMQQGRTYLEILLHPSRSLPPTLKRCWRSQGSPSGRPLALKPRNQQQQKQQQLQQQQQQEQVNNVRMVVSHLWCGPGNIHGFVLDGKSYRQG